MTEQELMMQYGGMPAPAQPAMPYMAQQQSPALSPNYAMTMQALENMANMRSSMPATMSPMQAYQNSAMVLEQQRIRNQQLQMRREQQMQEKERQKALARLSELKIQQTQQDMDPFYEYEEFRRRYPDQSEGMTYKDFALLGLKGTDAPSAVREYQFFQGLSDDEKERFLNIKRAGGFYDLPGGGKGYRLPGGDREVLVTPEEAITGAGDLAGTKARETAIGSVEGAKEASAPRDIREGNKVLDLINQVRKHPGLEGAVGLSSVFNIAPIPNTDRADFLALYKQLTGQAFLQAYQQLKGGGPITDREGQIATEAQNRLSLAQSKPAFEKALDEMERDMQMLLDEAKARGEIVAPAPGETVKPKRRRVFNPATGKLE